VSNLVRLIKVSRNIDWSGANYDITAQHLGKTKPGSESHIVGNYDSHYGLEVIRFQLFFLSPLPEMSFLGTAPYGRPEKRKSSIRLVEYVDLENGRVTDRCPLDWTIVDKLFGATLV
jgi:hypothetical protein